MAKSSSKKKSKKTPLPPPPSKSENKHNDTILLPQAFPQHLPRPQKGHFLRNELPYKESFDGALRGPYEGFVVDNADTLSSPPSNNDKDLSIKEQTIQSSLENMKRAGIFRTDVTQPFGLGTKCAKTYVTRCVVGNPGTTYKYLGLRMFAHPWTTEDHSQVSRKRKDRKRSHKHVENSMSNREFMKDSSTIRDLSQALTRRTALHLRDLDECRRQRRVQSTKGRSEFDICLINRMESNADLKPFVFGSSSDDKGKNKKNKRKASDTEGAKTSVSWHADSSLEHYSTIAVYQTLLGNATDIEVQQTKPNEEGKWWVALRVAHHAEGPQASQKRRGVNTESSIIEETPPIAVSLPTGSAYYLLDDFNHHHQHTVLTTGNASSAGVRYSCTFRLLRDSHNVQDWIERGNAAIRQFHKKGPKIWRSEQLLLTEIESEWIRQFYIQGSGNHALLWEPYWKTAIEELLSIWSKLEHRTKQTMDLLRAAAEERCGFDSASTTNEKPTKSQRKARERRKKALEKVHELVSRVSGNGENLSQSAIDIAYSELYEPFADLLEERAEMRELWAKREKDHVFRDMPPDCRPMEVPFRFEQEPVTNESSDRSQKSFGLSPLPKDPSKLKEMSNQLLQCGQAFRNGNASLLPPLWKTNSPKPDSALSKESLQNDHAKPLDWPGWSSTDQVFGLELQHPWAGAVVDGTKSIETRSYALPPSLIGKKIMVIESSSGQAGVSSLGNAITFSRSKQSGANKIIGWCIFSSVKLYKTEQEFRSEQSMHLVTPDSGYGWKDDATKKIYGWVVAEHCRFDESLPDAITYASGVRRFRSLFQLSKAPKANASTKKKSKRSNADRKNGHENGGKKKKRKRY